MSKIGLQKNYILKLPLINLEKPYKIDQPVVMIPEEEYKELLEDIQDLQDALKAEEDNRVEGGRFFSEYDKKRRKTSSK